MTQRRAWFAVTVRAARARVQNAGLKMHNLLLYGIWTVCEHEWYTASSYPWVRQCPHCGARRESGEGELR